MSSLVGRTSPPVLNFWGLICGTSDDPGLYSLVISGVLNKSIIHFLYVGKGAILSQNLLVALSVFPFNASWVSNPKSVATLAAGKGINQGCEEPGPVNLPTNNSGKIPDIPDNLKDSAHHLSSLYAGSVITSPCFAISLNIWIPP